MARILVIDDEPVLGHTARLLLEPYGHEVLVGDDGLRGVGLAQKQHPDAIVLDLMMPYLDGHQVLDMLARDPDTAGIPVVVLTAIVSEKVHEACLREGAKAVLAKPYEPEALAAAIDEALADTVA
jgi:twitching motility two-component system response regulator PilH